MHQRSCLSWGRQKLCRQMPGSTWLRGLGGGCEIEEVDDKNVGAGAIGRWG